MSEGDFRAVATSSAGFAYALGYPDGQAVPFGDLLHVVGQMTARVDIPVSVDVERGYSDDPEQVRENARRLCLKGAVGFNIEDGLPDGTLSSLELQIEKIRVLAGLKRELDLDFVINARTCVYWLNVGSEEGRLKTAILRGNAFREAGGDRPGDGRASGEWNQRTGEYSSEQGFSRCSRAGTNRCPAAECRFWPCAMALRTDDRSGQGVAGRQGVRHSGLYVRLQARQRLFRRTGMTGKPVCPA
ncbi:isocitrate lyase/phosphoenolpyruvate mutase family protein [Oxalobacter aliiformigenes]|nr:isocitrate lyase/phosphoenolpyruvate mutase family protein [Oxalobacter aliiformigenes]MCZ4064907.1 isocitrate lyase/phosphoenolpyruvate mutase family protein [Oxalobacter aliiformigenes]WAW00193.1 isocitrate lyase/phosphoenolpyruvate mutase family protein [Oxalobacter aliiformigenes]